MERAFIIISFQLEDFITIKYNITSIISQITRKAIKNIIKINIYLTSVLKAPKSLIKNILNIILIRQRGPIKKTTYLNK